MEHIALGSSGLKVTPLCLGTWNMAGGKGWGPSDDGAAVSLIRHALDRGCNFIDTARGYGSGHAEKLVGEATQGRREDVVIATKMLHCPPGNVAKDIEASLECLRTDYIDLYICHWPRPSLPLQPFFVEMVKARDAGKIRAIGVSNFDLHQMEIARSYGVVSLQPCLSILWRIPEATLAYCREHSIAVTSYSSLAQGLLTGRYSSSGVEDVTGIRSNNRLFSVDIAPHALRVARQLDAVAASHGCTPSQAALAWLLQTPGLTCAIVGASRPSQWDDTLGCLDVTLTPDEYDALDREGKAVWDMIGPDETMWGWKPT